VNAARATLLKMITDHAPAAEVWRNANLDYLRVTSDAFGALLRTPFPPTVMTDVRRLVEDFRQAILDFSTYPPTDIEATVKADLARSAALAQAVRTDLGMRPTPGHL